MADDDLAFFPFLPPTHGVSDARLGEAVVDRPIEELALLGGPAADARDTLRVTHLEMLKVRSESV